MTNLASQPPFQLDPQHIDPAWLAKWLNAIQEQQMKQTKYLRNISTVATIIGLLIIFSMVFAACSVFS